MSTKRSQLRDTVDASIFPTVLRHTPTEPFDNDNNSSSSSSRATPPRTNAVPYKLLQRLYAIYNWSIWSFMSVLLVSQVLGAVWNSSTTNLVIANGQLPTRGGNGVTTLTGLDETPFSDRLVVCVQVGRQYKPAQLRATLFANSTTTIDTTGASISGFRVVDRNELASDGVAAAYATTCDAIASMLDNIVDSCTALGYNVADGDTLRIVHGLESATTLRIANALPVLILPLWDASPVARFAIPGHDGSACVFRLEGMHESATDSMQGYVRAPSRAVREATTVAWLARPGGLWRNGWYDDPSGARWFADLVSTNDDVDPALRSRVFDVVAGVELDCAANATACAVPPRTEVWGDSFASHTIVESFTAVMITNGKQTGLSYYAIVSTVTVTSAYDLETLISNLALGFVLVRWFVCLAALANADVNRRHGPNATRTVQSRTTIGIGAIACARNFHFLPLVLVPRLRTTLAALCAVGCAFDGSASALANNWFVVYPAIGEFLLFVYSLVNILAKVLQRRVSDALFGPTLLALCLLHYVRDVAAAAGAFGIRDAHIPTLVSSREFSDLRLVDFVHSDIALRLNGGLATLFVFKLVLVALNALPLVICWQPTGPRSASATQYATTVVEKALAIRAPCVGGLGRATIYERVAVTTTASISTSGVGGTVTRSDGGVVNSASDDSTKCWLSDSAALPAAAAVTPLSRYEVVRLGYVVLGGAFVISIADWHVLCVLAPLRYVREPPSFRVTLFTLVDRASPADCAQSRVTVDDYPHVCRLDDPRLRAVSVLDITACPLY